jgi:hypothetical protein
MSSIDAPARDCDEPGQTRLYEFDKEEWWDVMRRAKPDIAREEFDRVWAEFVALKQKKKQQ